MYEKEDLVKYEYFEKVLKRTSVSFVLDELTGLVSRKYILDFAKDLVDNKIPFSLTILDIDDFKLINDKYGHAIGDECLSQLAEELRKYFADDWVVGRFGGDEFILLGFKSLTYDSMHDDLYKLFKCGSVLRHPYNLQGIEVSVTGTTGTAIFPKDATEYDDLFQKADKVLYRGKIKGSNCFIIYVEEKHKNIDMANLYNDSLTQSITKVSSFIESSDPLRTRLKNIAKYVSSNLLISRVMFVNTNNNVVSSDMDDVWVLDEMTASDLNELMGDEEVKSFIEIAPIMEQSHAFYEWLKKYRFESLAIAKISYKDKTFGYLIFLIHKSHRVWKEREMATLLFTEKLVASLRYLDDI